jgi:hypothetical protein
VYEYAITIKGDGGEFCIGSISEAAAAHWAKVPRDDLVSYVCDPEGHKLEPSDDTLRLNTWHEMNDIVSVYGVESFETLTVRDSQGIAVFETSKRSAIKKSETENQSVKDRAVSHNGKTVVFTRSREKGNCLFNLTTDEPFKRSRLSFNILEICGRTLITSLNYGDERLMMNELFSKAYDNHAARIGTLEDLSVR